MLILSTKTSHHTPTHTCILFPFLFFSSITPIYYRSDLRDRVCADRDQTPVLQSRPPPPSPPTSNPQPATMPEGVSQSLSQTACLLATWGSGGKERATLETSTSGSCQGSRLPPARGPVQLALIKGDTLFNHLELRGLQRSQRTKQHCFYFYSDKPPFFL